MTETKVGSAANKGILGNSESRSRQQCSRRRSQQMKHQGHRIRQSAVEPHGNSVPWELVTRLMNLESRGKIERAVPH